MGELPNRVRRALADNEAVEPLEGDGDYAVTTVTFETRVQVDATGSLRFAVTVRAPTLAAAAAEPVADVVADGWLDTFRRRLEDADMALEGATDGEPTARVEGDQLVVEAVVTDGDPHRGVADVRAFAEYVEGTYMEGVIPGYDYHDPVATMRQRARRTADGE